MPDVPNGSSLDTGRQQVKRPDGRFVPGDPRINRSGRPKSFDQFRELAQSIASRKKALEILNRWADSPEPALQKAFVEYAFGKVPDKLEATGLENKTSITLYFDHERGLVENESSRLSS